MPKLSLKTRLLQLRISTLVTTVLCCIAVVQFFAAYGIYNYEHLPLDVIETQLFMQRSPKLILKKNKPDCSYHEILRSKKSIHPLDIPKRFDDFDASGIVNGSFVPEHCNPKFSVAVILPYKNRQKQLDIFLPYMHNFLRRQNIHYKIYLIEQQDEKTFNKGLMINTGAKQAMFDKFPCIIIHDVDLLPLDEGNLYACVNNPRHMSASIDKFRYVLPYDFLSGGVTSIRADQFLSVNGFSNKFIGWGGEDDEFARRIEFKHLQLVRYPREISRYTMLLHHQEKRNSYRNTILSESKHTKGHGDGLDSMPHVEIKLTNHRLFKLVGAKSTS